MEVYIGNVDYRIVGLNKALLQHKSLTIIGTNNIYYAGVEELLKKIAPKKLSLYGKNDFILDSDEQQLLIGAAKKLLEPLVQHKSSNSSEYNRGDTKHILGKSIRLNLKDPTDKVIDGIQSIIDIAEDCLNENKPMYFLVVTD